MEENKLKNYSKYQKYYKHLGEFIDKFSSLEASLRIYLIEYTKIDNNMGKAIFSNYTVEQSILSIKKLHKAKKQNIHPHLSYLLEQIQIIQKDRNNLVHGQTFLLDDSDTFVSTNKPFSYSDQKIKETKIEITDLELMTQDIEHICKTIQVHFQPDELTDNNFKQVTDQGLETPWLYKKK